VVCSALQWCAVHCSGVQCIAVVCSALQWCAVHCSGVQCIAGPDVVCGVLFALCCSAWQSVAVRHVAGV